MSSTAIIVHGIVRADGTLQLDEKVDLPAGRVQVTVQPLPDLTDDPFCQRIQRIWTDQEARGHTPRTAEQIEELRRQMRDETDEEVSEALRLQEFARKARQDNEAEPE